MKLEEILHGLDPEQQEAVKAIRGPVSIIAGAGTGELLLPPKISVARAMIESWYNLVPLADGSARPTFESIESAQTLESWRK